MSGLKRFIAIVLYIIGLTVLVALVYNPYNAHTKALMDRNLFFFILGGMVIMPIGLGIVATSKKFVDSVWVAGIALIILVIGGNMDFYRLFVPELPRLIFAVIVVMALGIGFELSREYNSLVLLNESINESWGDVSVIYLKRVNLIGDLIKQSEKYMSHEETTLTKITQARSGIVESKDNDEKIKQINKMETDLINLNTVFEKYPDIKADKLVTQNMESIKNTERELGAYRLAYNGKVKSFNNIVKSFPIMLVAEKMNFKAREYFSDSSEKQGI